MKKILLIGHVGFWNRGCEAIVRGTVEIIKQYVPDSYITLFSGTPTFDSKIIHKSGILIDQVVPSVLEGAKKPTLKWVFQTMDRRILSRVEEFQDYLHKGYYKEADVVISIGGDNFSEDYGSPKRFFSSLRYAKRLGKKIVIWGASVGPFQKNLDQWTAILKSCDLITAREDITVQYLNSLGCIENVKRVSDPGFCMPSNLPADFTMLKQTGRITVGIGISDLIPRYKISREKYYKILSEFINYLISCQEAIVILVPHVINPGKKYCDDLRACLEVMKLPISKKFCSVLPGNLDATELKHCISQCDYFIGARTHSTIASLSMNVPTGSIGYSIKAIGINNDLLDTDDYVLSHSELSQEGLIRLFEKMKNNKSVIVKHLKNAVLHAKERALKAGEYLAEIME
ncbi:MAG: polysaccharide pyruvyl transferase family protein [Deltaproteobacteria bacterium]|nr:polysaccharide pyruvyl transferase family protein [Deltaproteobacteria bacterium]